MNDKRNSGANAAAQIEAPEEDVYVSLEETARLDLLKSHEKFTRVIDEIIIEKLHYSIKPSELMASVKSAFFKEYPSYSFFYANLPLWSQIIDSGVNPKEIDRVLSIASNLYEEYYDKNHTLYKLVEALLNEGATDKYSGEALELLSSIQRYKILEEFAVRNSGKGVAELASMLFPNREPLRHIPRSTAIELITAYNRLGKDAFDATVSSALKAALAAGDGNASHADAQSATSGLVKLPDAAPETYQGLRGPETPPAFVQRVYGPWLGHGLDRAHIRHLDPKLSAAIDNWMSRPGNEWPPEVDLPTRSEQNRRVVEQLRAQAPDGDINKVIGSFTMREAERLRSAAKRTK